MLLPTSQDKKERELAKNYVVLKSVEYSTVGLLWYCSNR